MCIFKRSPKIKTTSTAPTAPIVPQSPSNETDSGNLFISNGVKKQDKGKRSLMIKPMSSGVGLNI